ncbi:jg23498 [Pararge aegeria aegeria]|uniref:Jg23498 protein n=1 Tax=Pararge aegeria aegeria TaxID=348720 RepID=A0A8S4QVR2_9NEOP|nr:jg23498 [Pararge aegeria aegeria]
MENAGFPSGEGCGEDIERALMDLGPLLGVSIKEEVPDDLGDGMASRNNVVGAFSDQHKLLSLNLLISSIVIHSILACYRMSILRIKRLQTAMACIEGMHRVCR